jgi:hypothetical protein
MDNLEVKISVSSKELVFKPFLATAVSDIFFTIWGSHHTPAFHSFPNVHRSGILRYPESLLKLQVDATAESNPSEPFFLSIPQTPGPAQALRPRSSFQGHYSISLIPSHNKLESEKLKRTGLQFIDSLFSQPVSLDSPCQGSLCLSRSRKELGLILSNTLETMSAEQGLKESSFVPSPADELHEKKWLGAKEILGTSTTVWTLIVKF